MKKICLINPPTTRHTDDLFFPMGLITIGSALKSIPVEVQIIDFDFEMRRRPDITSWADFENYALKRIGEVKADVIGLSCICTNYHIVLLLAQAIKERLTDKRVILGGPQASASCRETLKHFPTVDVIVIGEGEHTITKLLSCDWEIDNLKKIEGIAFRSGNEIIQNPRAPLILDLDSLPMPDFSLLPFNEYLRISPMGSFVETGRGCPFICSFCSTSSMWERKYRIKSPARIHLEMSELAKKYGLSSFSLIHDNFTVSHHYIDEFCDYFNHHNTDNFIWSTSSRPDTLNETRMEKMAMAGCRGFFFGIDSGSQYIQKRIDKNMSVEHSQRMVKKAASLGIGVLTSWIIGFPEERIVDLNETITEALKSKLYGAVDVVLNRLAPLSATKIYYETKDEMVFDRYALLDLASRPFRLSGTDDLLARYPDLFSCYYIVSTPHLGDLDVGALSVYYNELINRSPYQLLELLKEPDHRPTSIFLDWLKWKDSKYPDQEIRKAFVSNTFSEYLSWKGNPSPSSVA